LKAVQSIRIEHHRERVYGDPPVFARYNTALHTVELVILTDDKAWIDMLIAYLHGETDSVRDPARPEIVSADPSLPEAPIDATFEDE
jgi:hypothetical protein